MPGHKGKSQLGFESKDITEIFGADALYEAAGIIAQSEQNAASLFGSRATFYSTEGSSICSRAMVYMAVCRFRAIYGNAVRPTFIAARNAHKAFLYAIAALDCDVVWLYGADDCFTLCQYTFAEDELKTALSTPNLPIAGVYITTPDYLGGTLDIEKIASLAHQSGTVLLVDQAHGAYLRFLPQSEHALQKGADLCCDSAHKTLPSLTGAAYLHVGQSAIYPFEKEAKDAMCFFGSTSPSYLTLCSLDHTNSVLQGTYKTDLQTAIARVNTFKETLMQNGFSLLASDPLKITVNVAKSGYSGAEVAAHLRSFGVEIEYADPDFVVLMATPCNTEQDFQKAEKAFLSLAQKAPLCKAKCARPKGAYACSAKEAMLSQKEAVLAKESLGRILASPSVACPPAVPIAVCGEVIDQNAMDAFLYYGIETITVIK